MQFHQKSKSKLKKWAWARSNKKTGENESIELNCDIHYLVLYKQIKEQWFNNNDLNDLKKNYPLFYIIIKKIR